MTSGLGISERCTRIMRPTPSKTDEDVLPNLEAWKRDKRELNELDDRDRGAEMSDKFNVTAMKCIPPIASRL